MYIKLSNGVISLKKISNLTLLKIISELKNYSAIFMQFLKSVSVFMNEVRKIKLYQILDNAFPFLTMSLF